MGEDRGAFLRRCAVFCAVSLLVLSVAGCQQAPAPSEAVDDALSSVPALGGTDASADTPAERPVDPSAGLGDDVAEGDLPAADLPEDLPAETDAGDESQADDTAALDLNGDSTVNRDDAEVFAAAIEGAEGDAAFDAQLDLDGDGQITFVDYQTWYEMAFGVQP